jgi:hypothetical protein
VTVLTPPGYTQGGTYSAKLDRVYNTTTRVVADASTQLRARQGFYSGRAPVYANPSGWDITMTACGGVVANTFASNSGDYELANDGTVQVTLAASSPTLNRQDIIGFQVKDNLFDASGLNTAVPVVIQGANSAGASADPSLPSSFIPVVRAIVPAASVAPTLQTLVRYTTNDGGALRIDSAAHRAELTPFAGLRIWRSDRGWYETYDSAWRVDGVAICTSTADRDAVITSPRSGQLAVTTDLDIVWQYDGATAAWVPAHNIGIVGGREITGTNNLGGTIGFTETMPTNMNTGTLSLLPNRRYAIHARIKTQATVTTDTWNIRIREGTVAYSGGTPGNQIRQFVWQSQNSALGWTNDISANYTTGASAVSRVFSVTAQQITGGGTLQFTGGDAGDDNLVGIWVEDKGPAGKVTTTAS